ncbi:hypothetical protein B0H14DRAFT_3148381 [Mycena olivaceomarginata]|nr:hypothetical protein B0H14DRAFT_3148381 [Mycena olivaceomarginata]
MNFGFECSAVNQGSGYPRFAPAKWRFRPLRPATQTARSTLHDAPHALVLLRNKSDIPYGLSLPDNRDSPDAATFSIYAPTFPPHCAFGPTRSLGTVWRRRPSLPRRSGLSRRSLDETPPAMPRRQLYRSHSSPLSCLEGGPREKAGGGVKWTRILVSLRVRLGIACPRCEPTFRVSFAIIFGVVQSGIHQSVPTAILAAFSHTPSFSVHGVVPATRLSLGTRSHNRSPLNCNSSKYVQHRIRALGPTPLEACSSTISLAMYEMIGAALGWAAYDSEPFWPSCARTPRPHFKL